MPRADEPRITIRLSKVDHAILEEAARIRGVRPASLLRGIGMEGARRVVETERAPRLPRAPSTGIPKPGQVLTTLPPVESNPEPVEIPKEGPDRAAFFRDLTSRKR